MLLLQALSLHCTPLPRACASQFSLLHIACSDAFSKVRNEIIENVEATYKETDLFKMFQTGDVSKQQGAGCMR